jgi:hypothetical protein
MRLYWLQVKITLKRVWNILTRKINSKNEFDAWVKSTGADTPDELIKEIMDEIKKQGTSY